MRGDVCRVLLTDPRLGGEDRPIATFPAARIGELQLAVLVGEINDHFAAIVTTDDKLVLEQLVRNLKSQLAFGVWAAHPEPYSDDALLEHHVVDRAFRAGLREPDAARVRALDVGPDDAHLLGPVV